MSSSAVDVDALRGRIAALAARGRTLQRDLAAAGGPAAAATAAADLERRRFAAAEAQAELQRRLRRERALDAAGGALLCRRAAQGALAALHLGERDRLRELEAAVEGMASACRGWAAGAAAEGAAVERLGAFVAAGRSSEAVGASDAAVASLLELVDKGEELERLVQDPDKFKFLQTCPPAGRPGPRRRPPWPASSGGGARPRRGGRRPPGSWRPPRGPPRKSWPSSEPASSEVRRRLFLKFSFFFPQIMKKAWPF